MAFALEGPTLIEMKQGETARAVYRILATSKPYRNVTLSVSGQPAGLTASFSPLSGKPTFQSTLTVTASSSLAAGDYPIIIRARDAKSSKTMPIVFRNTPGPNIPPPIVPPPPFTADVWVDATKLDDSLDGLSEATAKKTFLAGVDVLNNQGGGKRLAIKQGTYAEQYNSNSRDLPNGTSWNDATEIMAYPGHTVTLTGSAQNFAWPSGTGKQFMEYLIIDGIIFDANGSSVDDIVSLWGDTRHIRFNNCKFVGAATNHNNLAVRKGTFTGHTGGLDVQILNCESYNSIGNAHGLYAEQWDMIIDNFYSHDNNDEGAAGGIQLYHEIAGPAFDHPGNCTISNTKLANNGTGFFLYGTGHLVYNVIIYGSTGSGIFSDGGSGQNIDNVTAYNNGTGIDHAGASVTNCIAYSNTGGDFSGAGTRTTCWQTSDGNPNFLNAAGGDFHLTGSSPATVRNGGTTIGAFSTDYDGVTRPQGSGWSIGAFEIS